MKEKGVESILAKDGAIMTEVSAVRNRCKEYCEQLLKVDKGGATDDPYWGRGLRSGRRLEERKISRAERNSLKKMECYTADGANAIIPKNLQKGRGSIMEWLKRLSKVCVREDAVRENWKRVSIVSLQKGKGDRQESAKYRAVRLVTIPGKVYGGGENY